MLRASDRFPFVLVEVGDRMNQHQLRKITFPNLEKSASPGVSFELPGRRSAVPGWAV